MDYIGYLNAFQRLAVDGLLIDGAHHKQWYLERILESSGVDINLIKAELEEDGFTFEPGVAP